MKTMSELITRLLLQHTHSEDMVGALAPDLSIRDELGVESLSLVSVLVELGAELEVDITESGVELARLQTVGDLIALGDELRAIRSGADNSILPTTNDTRGQESP